MPITPKRKRSLSNPHYRVPLVDTPEFGDPAIALKAVRNIQVFARAKSDTVNSQEFTLAGAGLSVLLDEIPYFLPDDFIEYSIFNIQYQILDISAFSTNFLKFFM